MKKTIKILNITFIIVVCVFFILGSGFTLLGLLTSGIFQIIFGGYLIAAIFGTLAFKKDYFLALSLVGWVIFVFAISYDTKEVKNNYRPADIYFADDKTIDYLKTHNFCKITSDCTPVITSCEPCANYKSTINKRYEPKYSDLLLEKCEGVGRVCDAMPSTPKGQEVKCIQGECLFVDKQ